MSAPGWLENEPPATEQRESGSRTGAATRAAIDTWCRPQARRAPHDPWKCENAISNRHLFLTLSADFLDFFRLHRSPRRRHTVSLGDVARQASIASHCRHETCVSKRPRARHAGTATGRFRPLGPVPIHLQVEEGDGSAPKRRRTERCRRDFRQPSSVSASPRTAAKAANFTAGRRHSRRIEPRGASSAHNSVRALTRLPSQEPSTPTLRAAATSTAVLDDRCARGQRRLAFGDRQPPSREAEILTSAPATRCREGPVRRATPGG